MEVMSLRYEVGFRLVDKDTHRTRPERLLDAVLQLQDFSMTDVKLRDVLLPEEDYPWPYDPPHAGEYVYVAAPPDELGPISAHQSEALLQRLEAEGRSGAFPGDYQYPNGALFVPWIQRPGWLKGGPLDGIYCMPLGGLKVLAGDERGEQLIRLSAETLFPIAVVSE
jgi:hypothetical protein